MKHVIIGNGIAGSSAASAIRKTDPGAEILIISREPYPFYSRVRLIEYLEGTAEKQNLFIFKDEWYSSRGIKQMLGTEVVGVEPGKKYLVLNPGGKTLKYDKLLIATGGKPAVPSIPGAALPGVFTIRTIRDAEAIREQAAHSNSVIVVGGGVLGLEVGNALLKHTGTIHIIEYFARLLPRQMDVDGSLMLERKLEERGMHFHLAASVAGIEGKNTVKGITLKGGSFIGAEMVIIAAGIKSEVSIFPGILPEGTKGITVNDRMETNIPDIYAAGDAAVHRGIYYGIWPAAEKQGSVAGAVMAGADVHYEGTVPSNILKVGGIDLLSAGNIDTEGTCRSLWRIDRDKGVYRKLVIDDERVVGCILFGDLSGKKQILDAISQKKTLNEIGNTADF